MELTPLSAFGWEFFGTAMLLLFGNGVCAAVNLRTSAAKGTGWLMIAFGWGLGVFIGASIADPTGGHLNPAVTIWAAITGNLSWSLVPAYIAGQMLGAMVGAGAAYLAYKQLFDHHDEAIPGGIFFTRPAHPHNGWNCVTEFIGTFALLAFIAFGPSSGELGPLSYFGVAFIIVAIGLSVGTPTGYAINPVRDLGPRLMYAFVLPFKNKESASWNYAWVPIIGPLLAAVAVGLLSLAV